MADILELLKTIHSYNPAADDGAILAAYEFAKRAHDGQLRLTGEPYITHPVEIANILSELQMDMPTIIAALLHDVIEDTPYTYEDIETSFGTEVADLVEGVTKIARMSSNASPETSQIDTFRKMFVAMAKDLRVIIIKLADRLHNMRTLDAMSREKQIQKSQETLDIYAPIAHRLGIYKLKMEFEDLALRYLDPSAYRYIANAVAKKRSEREAYLNQIIEAMRTKMASASIACDITGRQKHFYSIYKKMQTGRSFEEIYDLTAIRVLVDSVADCYAALGWVHELWKPIPNRIKDYIAMPKPNMYQSLHTTVLGPGATPVEIQIRTYEMHNTAEYGIAAHYKYKEGISSDDELAKRLYWIKQLKEIEEESDNETFYTDAAEDLYPSTVFTFTPKGRVIDLPVNSTPVDFAYRIHTEIGHKCSGAKVNNRIVPLNYRLVTGDIVEILTNPNSKGPSRDWLSFVASVSARNKIRSFFRRSDRQENIIKGRNLIEKEARKHDIDLAAITKNEYTEFVFSRFSISSWDELYNNIGSGVVSASVVLNRIRDFYRDDFAKENIAEGKAAMEREIRLSGLDVAKVIRPEYLDFVRQRFEMNSWDDLFNAIGYGGLSAANVLSRIRENFKDDFPEAGASRGKHSHERSIVIENFSDLAYKFAQCCTPLPGDEVIGYITRGRGVTIHRSDCVNITNAIEPERLIPVSWADSVADENFAAEIFIKAVDRPKLLADISTLISNEGINISGSSVRTLRDSSVHLSFDVVVASTAQVEKLLNKISQVESVMSAYRV